MNTSAAKSCIFIGIYSLLFSLFFVYLRRVLYYLLLLLSILPHKQLKLLLYISKILANGNRYFLICMMRHTKRRQVPTSFPGSLFSASIAVEKRPWFTLVTCLPESGRFTKCVLGDGRQCRPCRHGKEGNQHAIDFVGR